jgi:hypothetical protein
VQACHKKQGIRINQKNKLLCKQQVTTSHSHAHHLGVKPIGLHSREATHGTTTLLIKQGLIFIKLGHHLDVQEAITLIARLSTTPTPQAWVLSGNFSKEILTEIRSQGSGTWVA